MKLGETKEQIVRSIGQNILSEVPDNSNKIMKLEIWKEANESIWVKVDEAVSQMFFWDFTIIHKIWK